MSVEGSSSEELEFADRVARACHEQYRALSKTGKPSPRTEWTPLSAVVQATGDRLEVVALGTGSKCLGANAMSPSGDVLNDAHAEVMARRAFLRYLYHQAERFHSTGTSGVFGGVEGGRCAFRRDVAFHFYTSHMPCGDAAIFPKENANTEDYGDRLENASALPDKHSGNERTESNNGDFKDRLENASTLPDKHNENERTESNNRDFKDRLENASTLPDKHSGNERTRSNNEDSEGAEAKGEKRRSETEPRPCKQRRTERPVKDIHRTGARCVATSQHQDSHAPGVGYHVLGALRTKPGRGDPTLSLSCSDKLARWNAVGCQGALLSVLVQPVRFASLIVGGGCSFSRESLSRAVVERTRACGRAQRSPLVVQASVAFSDGRRANGPGLACASSIAWCLVPDRPLEVAVKGRKQGVTKKVASTAAGRLQICKRELARRFVSVLASSPLAEPLTTERLARTPYGRLKAMAAGYREDWLATRARCFPSWPDKPASLLDFALDE